MATIRLYYMNLYYKHKISKNDVMLLLVDSFNEFKFIIVLKIVKIVKLWNSNNTYFCKG